MLTCLVRRLAIRQRAISGARQECNSLSVKSGSRRIPKQSKIGCAREEELLFCAWESFPRVALCRAVADSQLISVGERGGSCWETKPILSGFDFDRREIEAVYKFIWLSGVSLNSFRFCTNLDWIWSSLVAEISYTRAQSENANYFRALLQPPMTRNFLCAACIMLFIHNDETTYKRPETINSRLVFCILSLFTRSHCSWRSFFSKSLPLSTR